MPRRPLRQRRVDLVAAGVTVAVAGLTLAGCSSTTDGVGHPGQTPAIPSTASGASSAGQSSTAPGSPASTAASASASASAPSGSAVVTTPVRTVLVTHTTSGAAYQVKVWVTDQQTACAAHAYGAPVIAFLQAHPCASVNRLLATTMVNGRGVELARETIAFQGDAPQVYTTASDFRALVEKDGTGNLEDLLRAGARFTGSTAQVADPDAFDAEAQDAVVTVLDAWYLSGPTPENDPPLEVMAQDLYLQF